MSYALMHQSAQYVSAVDVVVYYDSTASRFLVTSTDKGSGCYSVSYQELLGDVFKYEDQIIQEILYGIPEDDEQFVLFTNFARNAISLLISKNRLK